MEHLLKWVARSPSICYLSFNQIITPAELSEAEGLWLWNDNSTPIAKKVKLLFN
jgi:hypothetical protein